MNILNAIIPVFGFFTGSFLNLCIDRLPRNIYINPINLFCPSCEKPIKPYDRVPVLSYIFLKGKCRQCSAHISLRYPLMEFVVAFLFFFLFRKYGLSLEFFVKTLFILLLILVSFIDLKFKMIPDILTLGGLSAGLMLAFFRKPFFFYQDALYGIFVCGGILFAVAFCCRKFIKQEVIGSGDIKLLCMIGAFCGIKGAIFSFLAGSLFGTLIGVPIMLIEGKNAKYAIPFGPFLSLGALIFLFYGDRFVYSFINVLSGR